MEACTNYVNMMNDFNYLENESIYFRQIGEYISRYMCSLNVGGDYIKSFWMCYKLLWYILGFLNTNGNSFVTGDKTISVLHWTKK